MSDLKTKLTSRKFWIAVAAALASIGGSVAGIATDNTALTTTGMSAPCSARPSTLPPKPTLTGKSSKAKRADHQPSGTTKQVTATTNDKATVVAALAPTEKEAPNA